LIPWTRRLRIVGAGSLSAGLLRRECVEGDQKNKSWEPVLARECLAGSFRSTCIWVRHGSGPWQCSYAGRRTWSSDHG
jgi:hypothetical protein